MLRFEIRVLEDAGKLEEALDRAMNPVSRFLDQTLEHEIRGHLLMKLGKLDEAAKEYETLIERSPEKGEYYYAYEKCKKLGILTRVFYMNA